MGESGWRWNALNSSSGAYGIPQALPAEKMAAAGADWRTNAATQIRWGLGYIRAVYGSPAAAYQAWLSRSPHWYGKGGWINEPVAGIGLRTGQSYGFGEHGREYVSPEGKMGGGRIEALLQALIRAVADVADAVDQNSGDTARGVASALGGAGRGAAFGAMYGAR
jgi:hypothetical protein